MRSTYVKLSSIILLSSCYHFVIILLSSLGVSKAAGAALALLLKLSSELFLILAFFSERKPCDLFQAMKDLATMNFKLIDFYRMGGNMPEEVLGGHGSILLNIWAARLSSTMSCRS